MKYVNAFSFVALLLGSFSLSAQDDASQSVEPITASHFYKKGEIDNPSISPNGEYIVYEKQGAIMLGNAQVPFQQIYKAKSYMRVVNTMWLGNNVLSVRGRHRKSGDVSFLFIELEQNPTTGKVTVSRSDSFSEHGYIIDPLLNNPNAVLFAVNRIKNEQFYRDVYFIELFAGKKHQFKKNQRINLSSGKISIWETDGEHKLVAGISVEEEVPSLWLIKGRTRKMSRIWTGEKGTEISVYGLSLDGTKLWVLTDHESDTKVLKAFNFEMQAFEPTLAALPEKDIVGLFLNQETREPQAIIYFENGVRHYQFIDPQAGSQFEAYQNKYPDERLTILDVAADNTSYVVKKQSQTDAGKLAVCNQELGGCQNLGSISSWLDDVKLAITQSFKVTTQSGIEIESFLTLPHTDAKKIPLIVKPHGGPIGVFDTGGSHDTQWLAYNGYAVLEVNYRGSGGYGNNFESEGLRQWGRGIEDDIELAMDVALKDNPVLDSSKACIYGGSYGGYSAIMGIIRSPDRYQCAASFAGVTDLPLLFSNSNMKSNEALTAELKRITGDPEAHKQELMDYSPVYNVERIAQPLLLIHGTKDDRVDVEHSWRLSSMMKLKGIEHELLIMDDTGHGLSTLVEVETMYQKLIPFLDSYLKD